MNKIFKIVFNAARGKMMVVNEATSSVQSGKNKAVAVTVGTALALASFGASALTLEGQQTMFNAKDQFVYHLEDLSDNTLKIVSTGRGIWHGSSTPSRIVWDEEGNVRQGALIIEAAGQGINMGGATSDFKIQANTVDISGSTSVYVDGKLDIDANVVNLIGAKTGISDDAKDYAALTVTANKLAVSGANYGVVAQSGQVNLEAETVTIDGGQNYAIYTKNTGRVAITGETELKGKVLNNGSLSLNGVTTTDSQFTSNGTLKLSKDAQLTLAADSSISGTFLTEKGSVVTLENGATVSLNGKAGNSVNDGVIKNLSIKGDGHVDIAASGVALGLGTNTLDVTSVKIDLDGNGKAITAYGTNTVTAKTITIESEGDGIHAMGDANGSVKLTGDTINIAAGVGGYAIQNASGNEKENVVVNGKDVTLTSDGRTAISQQGAGSTVVKAEKLTIEGFVDGGLDDKVNAVNVSKGSLSLTGTETVSISNGKGGASKNAIGVQAAGTLNVTGGDVTVSGKTNVAGVLSMDADSVTLNESLVSNNGEVSLVGDTVSVTSATDVAIRLVNADVNISANKVVIASDTNWHGVRAKQSTAVIDADEVAISSQYAGVYAEYDSQVTLGNEESSFVKIDVAGQGEDSELAGLWARNPGSSVTVNGSSLEVNVSDSEHQYVYGLLAQGMTTTGTPVTFVNVNSDNAVINSSAVGVMATGDGEVNLNSKSSIVVDAPVAIEVRNGAKVNVNTGKDAKADVVLNGNVDFHQAYAGQDGLVTAEVTLNLNTANSVWNGNALASWKEGLNPTKEIFEGAKLNLTLANGAQWNPVAIEKIGDLTQTASTFALTRQTPTGGQFGIGVNNLNLEGGVINLQDGVQVDVGNLEGSGGTLNLGTDNGETGAGLNVGSLSNKTKLDVNLMNADLTKELTSDDLTPEQTQELLKNVAGGSANVTTEVQEGMYNDGYTSNGKDGVVATKTNTVMSNTLDLASSAPLAMNRLLMNDVRKRMGDLRAAEGTHGVWARYDGGKLSGANGLENDFTTVQVGIDTVPVADAPRFGVAFAYTKSDTDMARGSADMDAFSLAFYGTKMYDNGVFVDVIGRMATADTDVMVDGDKKGSMDNVALSLSGELGWRFDVTEKFYFEPQAELTYTYVNADKLDLSGSMYDFDAVDSLMARVGFAAGFKCPSNFGDVYVRASAVHEFLGDASVMGANGTIHEVDGKDTWVEFGIGANFNVNKNTYVYVDIERTEGAKLEEDWRANVGVRFAF